MTPFDREWMAEQVEKAFGEASLETRRKAMELLVRARARWLPLDDDKAPVADTTGAEPMPESHYRELTRLAIAPQGVTGKSRVRDQTALERSGLARFVDCDGQPAADRRACGCEITAEGRAVLREETDRRARIARRQGAQGYAASEVKL